MAREFSITPRPVSTVDTPFRKIAGMFPPPQSVPILTKLHELEPRAMRGQPPVIWDRAEGCQVFDRWGNVWLDWSSGVLITNAGHGRQEVVNAIVQQASSKLLTNYCFPSEIRLRLVERLSGLLPEPLKKIFLLTTGSETAECAIKLARMHGVQVGGRSKHVIVSFEKAFHGRTLGSQLAGGIPSLKDWIINTDSGFVQAPFPDGYRTEDNTFTGFEKSLHAAGVRPQDVAGVMLETYQGGSAAFAPAEYMRALRDWCTTHQALLVCDEVQAGFGRTGTMWGFEHYRVVPDLALFGKGISSSLPISAVAGRPDVMDLPPEGAMTSTHSGNPVCCAAALASIDLAVELVQNAADVGALLHQRLQELQSQFPQIGTVAGKGLVAGVACVTPGTKNPDGDLAWQVVERCVERGLLMFSPVGFGGATVKIAPPLSITRAAVNDGVSVLTEAFAHAVASRTAVA